jgi:hypothetical protein
MDHEPPRRARGEAEGLINEFFGILDFKSSGSQKCVSKPFCDISLRKQVVFAELVDIIN